MTISERIESKLTRLAQGLLLATGYLPLASGRSLGRMLGRLAYAADSRHRRIVIDNLRHALGQEIAEEAILPLARNVFTHLGQIPFELGWSLRLPRTQWRRHFRIVGLQHIKNAQAEGKGVLLLTAHMGNWELLPIAGAMADLPVHIVFRPLDVLFFDRLIGRLRGRFGAGLIAAKKGAFAILRALRQGGCVALLMDQNVDWYDGVFVDFFGRRACTSKGLALIARRTGAPVVPVFLAREAEGFIVEFGPPIPVLSGTDTIGDLEEATQRYTRAIEIFIRRYPDQWFWAHRRWKTRPYRPWPRQISSSDVHIRQQPPQLDSAFDREPPH